MIIEYEQHYCKSCYELFNDIVHKPYYTRNNFIDNQACLIYGLSYKREVTRPNYHTQCPHCYSVHNENVKKIEDMFIVYTKTGKQISFNRLYSLPKYKRYADIHRKIIAKHLNTITDK